MWFYSNTLTFSLHCSCVPRSFSCFISSLGIQRRGHDSGSGHLSIRGFAHSRLVAFCVTGRDKKLTLVIDYATWFRVYGMSTCCFPRFVVYQKKPKTNRNRTMMYIFGILFNESIPSLTKKKGKKKITNSHARTC